MNPLNLLLHLFLLTLLALGNNSQAQTLTISGEVTKPLTLQAADIKAMPHTEVTGKDHDGNEHRFAGVPLVDLLKQAGASVGNELRGANLAKYVLVTAADGYEAIFALPELDPAFALRTILLADRVDGTDLPAGTGPFRIIVPDEKKLARWVRQVKAIEVKLAK
ncbi:molybdopterin-dependent oxidoreductase [Spirosoma fluminis]